MNASVRMARMEMEVGVLVASTVGEGNLAMTGSFPLAHWVCGSWRGLDSLSSVASRWGWAQQSALQPSAEGLLCFVGAL